MRRVFLAGLMLGCMSFSVAAAQHYDIDRSQTEAAVNDMQARMNAPQNPALTPVENMTCEQMAPELIAAGQQMNAQLDPSFAANVQNYRDDAMSRQRTGMETGMGMGLACAIPGVGMACGAMMQAQMANQMRQAQQDQARADEFVGQLNDSTQGIDMARMQALGERWEAQECEMPEQGAGE